MTAEEREEYGETFYVKAQGVGEAIRAQYAALREDPKQYFKALFFALSSGGYDLRAILYGFFYFVEAVLVRQEMQRHGQQHVHVHFSGAAATVGLILKQGFGQGFSLMVHGPDVIL